jgi:tripartite ATP-independent transporter DctM subunit
MPFVLAVIVLGSIYGGFATPTEAAGVGCGGAVLVAVFRKRLNWEGFKKAVFDTGQVTGMMLWLVFGAQTVIGIYTLAGGDDFVKNAISSVAFGSWGTIFYMQVIWIFLGMFIDWIGIIMLTGPLFIPIITSMGFDSVWFGIIFSINMQIAYLSPPFGPSAIYLKGIVPEDISLGIIYRSVFPFMALCFLPLILTLIFPQLALWLPQKVMGR